MMALSDMVVGNLTTLYLATIAVIKAYGLLTGKSYGGGVVLVLSTAAVVFMLVGALMWDVSRKAAYTVGNGGGGGGGGVLEKGDVHSMCRGGICWHGVAVKSPAAQVRFRLPQHQPGNLM